MSKTKSKGRSKKHESLIAGLDGTAIAEGIRKGDYSAREVLEDTYNLAEQVNEELNAVVAWADRSGSQMRCHNKNGVFADVPTFAKDEVNVAGMPTRHGSKSLPDRAEKKNEAVVDQFLSTGCVIIGKTATSEFGLLPAVETDLNGATRNPYNTDYSTGGSSGGSGAMVAAGVVPFAHAMDGGGSIRIPASCCGLVGLKPSRGRHVGSPTKNLPIDIVTQGIVSRTVRDTANYWYDVEQHHSPRNLPNIGHVTGPGKQRMKIGMFTQTPSGIESHPDVVDAIRDAGRKCVELGHHIEMIDNPFSHEVKPDFMLYYAFLANLIQNFGKVTYNWKFDSSELEEFTRELGRAFPKVMIQAPQSFTRLKRNLLKDYEKATSEYDLLLCPTLSTPVPRIGYFAPDTGFLAMVQKLNHYIHSTIIQNATGMPAISLPMAKCGNGLPIGAQFSAGMGEERKLIELAFELEAAKAFV